MSAVRATYRAVVDFWQVLKEVFGPFIITVAAFFVADAIIYGVTVTIVRAWRSS